MTHGRRVGESENDGMWSVEIARSNMIERYGWVRGATKHENVMFLIH